MAGYRRHGVMAAIWLSEASKMASAASDRIAIPMVMAKRKCLAGYHGGESLAIRPAKKISAIGVIEMAGVEEQ
jgi:hypothetical protein